MHPKRREERAKLVASFLSNLGAGTILAGFIAPAFGGEFNWLRGLATLLAGVLIHISGQAALHFVVREEMEAKG